MVHKIGTLHWRKGLQYATTYCKRNSLSLFVHAMGALIFVGGQDYINQHLPIWWIGRTTAKDQALLCWPPRSPDLIPCDFFLWGYVTDCVFIPPVPQDLSDLWRRNIAAIAEVDCDMLQRVWMETDYCVDVCRVTKARHIEHLLGMRVSLSICRSHVIILSAIQVTNFMTCVRVLWITLYFEVHRTKYYICG
jgi:hypothetical protein